MSATRKWLGTVNGVWALPTNFDTLPVDGDSITFHGADLAGAHAACTAGPLVTAPVSLVAVDADTEYVGSTGGGVVCYANMTVGTLTVVGGCEMNGGVVTTATFTSGVMSGGTATTANFLHNSRLEGGTVGTAVFGLAGGPGFVSEMDGGIVGTAVFNDASVLQGGAITGAMTWNPTNGAFGTGIFGPLDLSGCVVTINTSVTINACTTSATTVLRVMAGTTTLGANLSAGVVHAAQGATLDGGGYTLTSAEGPIQGGGTVTNAVMAAGSRASEGVIDGGTNTGITFQRGKTGTGCTTGTAT